MFILCVRELLIPYMDVWDVSIVLTLNVFSRVPCVCNYVNEPGYVSAPSGIVLCTPRWSGW